MNSRKEKWVWKVLINGFFNIKNLNFVWNSSRENRRFCGCGFVGMVVVVVVVLWRFGHPLGVSDEEDDRLHHRGFHQLNMMKSLFSIQILLCRCFIMKNFASNLLNKHFFFVLFIATEDNEGWGLSSYFLLSHHNCPWKKSFVTAGARILVFGGF